MAGHLSIAGKVDVYTKLIAANGLRHFYIGSDTGGKLVLTLKWLNLTGGYTSFSPGLGGSVGIKPGTSGELKINNCIFSDNKGFTGGQYMLLTKRL